MPAQVKSTTTDSRRTHFALPDSSAPHHSSESANLRMISTTSGERGAEAPARRERRAGGKKREGGPCLAEEEGRKGEQGAIRVLLELLRVFEKRVWGRRAVAERKMGVSG